MKLLAAIPSLVNFRSSGSVAPLTVPVIDETRSLAAASHRSNRSKPLKRRLNVFFFSFCSHGQHPEELVSLPYCTSILHLNRKSIKPEYHEARFLLTRSSTSGATVHSHLCSTLRDRKRGQTGKCQKVDHKPRGLHHR